jgi:hypothetical protein
MAAKYQKYDNWVALRLGSDTKFIHLTALLCCCFATHRSIIIGYDGRSISVSRSADMLHQWEAQMEEWAATPGSSLTFIRPQMPLNILRTCHLVNKEAAPLLQNKLKDMKLLPTKFLVHWSAIQALFILMKHFLVASGWKNNLARSAVKPENSSPDSLCYVSVSIQSSPYSLAMRVLST